MAIESKKRLKKTNEIEVNPELPEPALEFSPLIKDAHTKCQSQEVISYKALESKWVSYRLW